MNRRDWLIIFEEMRKNIKIILCYPLAIVFWVFFPIIWVIPFIFQGRAFVGSLASSAFKDLTGSAQYIPFVLIGAIVSTYMFSALYGIGNSFRMESYWGTLEFILGSPAKKIMVILGKAASEGIFSTFFATAQIFICIFVFGLEVTLTKFAPVLFIMLLLLLGLYGMGIGLAGITLQIKESRGIIHALDSLLFLFTPIRYPVQINPITHAVSLFIPLTYGLVAIRGILLVGRPLSSLLKEIWLLLILDIFLVGFGLFIFTWLEKRVRKAGTVSHY